MRVYDSQCALLPILAVGFAGVAAGLAFAAFRFKLPTPPKGG
jgi:hypothetical protein